MLGAGGKIVNPLLASLDITPNDKIISIKETGNVDANFLITHLMKHVLQDGGKLCLVMLHNTLGHYQNIGKRLGYDFLRMIEEGAVRTVEPLKEIVDNIGTDCSYFLEDKEQIVTSLFLNIKQLVEELATNSDRRAYIIIDDVSHLLDLSIDLKYIISFINYCVNLVNEHNVSLIISNHVCNKSGEIISNSLNYVSDVNIEVLPLKTGISTEVTGVINVEKANVKQANQYHFKAYDKGIRTFHPGESLYNLYK